MSALDGLATAPPEATPAGSLTLKPDYAIYADDAVTFYYDELPRGTYDFYFRLRSSVEGSFSHPPAKAELMYQLGVSGNSDGTRIKINPREETKEPPAALRGPGGGSPWTPYWPKALRARQPQKRMITNTSELAQHIGPPCHGA